MTQQYIVTSPPLARPKAHELSDILEAAIWPEALAISMVETDEAQDLWQVEAIYDEQPDLNSLKPALNNAGFEKLQLCNEPLEQLDWVRQSLEGLQPVRAGKLIIHGAHDRGVCKTGDIGIEIDAGLAFGTGHHNTTKGCLLALQEVLKTGHIRNCLDVGTGSGVLAIAASKLANVKSIASDIDSDAVEVAIQNAKLNGTGHLVQCVTAAGLNHRLISTSGPYDLVFANILANPLIALAPQLAKTLTPNGSLILSGITENQIRMVRAAYELQGLRIDNMLIQDNWATLTMHQKKRGTR